jgi:hypothetical protein
MTHEDTGTFVKKRLALAAAAATIAVCAALPAQAQQNAPPPRPPAAVTAPAPDYRPGMLESVGRWFKDSFSYLGSGARGATDAATGAAKGATDAATGAARATADAAKGTVNAAKDAADAAVRLTGARVVDAHERCITAANGAPDCYRAAEAVCRSKGYSSGSSLNIESERNCPPETWFARRREPGECKVQSFVTRAVCQ